MFIDAFTVTPGTVLQADVCIIGGGAAGITIARELIGHSSNVVLLESGGFDYDNTTQSLYHGKNTGLSTFGLHVNRLRYFGGTTNHWAGHCRPLDPIDFEQKDWIPNSGWPINRADIDPFYKRAQPILGLDAFRYEDLSWYITKTGSPELDLLEGGVKSVVYNQSPPTRFGQEYRSELKQAKNVRVYLNANVLELISNESSNHIDSLSVACIDGPRFTLKARIIILASGGIENARLLLLSDSQQDNGIGNNQGLVGRYFMDHVLLRPGADISFTRLDQNLSLYNMHQPLVGGKMFAILAAAESALRREKLTNFRIHMVFDKPKYKQPVAGIFTDLDGHVNVNPLEITDTNSIALHLVLEPIPNPDSRITLSIERDIFKQRKVEADWRLNPADLSNAERALQLVAKEFGRAGLGRAYGAIFKDNSQWPNIMEAGKHHCGTTRMADNAKTGVVDRDCRVFDVDNLYVTGSSVFPTIGYANPTLTIVALALRLVDHLKREYI